MAIGTHFTSIKIVQQIMDKNKNLGRIYSEFKQASQVVYDHLAEAIRLFLETDEVHGAVKFSALWHKPEIILPMFRITDHYETAVTGSCLRGNLDEVWVFVSDPDKKKEIEDLVKKYAAHDGIPTMRNQDSLEMYMRPYLGKIEEDYGIISIDLSIENEAFTSMYKGPLFGSAPRVDQQDRVFKCSLSLKFVCE